MTIDAALNENSPFNISEQMTTALQSQERYQILSLPLTDDMLADIMKYVYEDSEDATLLDDSYKRIEKYFNKSTYLDTLNNNSYSARYDNYTDYSNIEYQEASRLHMFDRTWTMAAPPVNQQDLIMLFTIGSRTEPQAGVYLTFENVEKGIMTITSGMLWSGLMDDLLENFPNWFETDAWYSQEEINAAKQEVADVSREIEPESVGDVNQYLIETAAQLNNRFEKFLRDESDNAYLREAFANNESLFDTIPDDCKSFDLAAVMTSEGTRNFPASYAAYFITDAGYGIMGASLFATLAPKLYMPRPTEWTSDMTVLLGSAEARHFAMVSFYNLANVQSQGSSGMLVRYAISALPEDQSFTEIQSYFAGWEEKSSIEDKLTYASPYGTWDDCEGFTNLYTEY